MCAFRQVRATGDGTLLDRPRSPLAQLRRFSGGRARNHIWRNHDDIDGRLESIHACVARPVAIRCRPANAAN